MLEGKAKNGKDLLEILNYATDYKYSDREFFCKLSERLKSIDASEYKEIQCLLKKHNLK